jgi:hypothetical protein
MANQSRLKFDKLRVVEDALRQLQAKDRQIEEYILKKVELQHQLDAIKLECTRETWLLKKEIQNREEKNKSKRKPIEIAFS